MAVEASAVQISINVVDNSAAGVQKATSNLNTLGAAGTRAGQQMRRGMEEAGVGALSSVERIRLLNEEVGVRLPRAMVRLAAESKIASAAISAIGPGLVALGSIQIGYLIFSQLIDGAKKFYEKWIDVDGAIDKYNEKAAEAATKKFDENRSIEDLVDGLKQANQQMDQLNQKRSSSPSLLGMIGTVMGASESNGAINPQDTINARFGMKDANNLNAAQGAQDEARSALAAKQHEQTLQAIEDAHNLAAARAEGTRKAAVELDKQRQIDAENQKYKVSVLQQQADIANRGKQPGDEGYITVDPHSGEAERNAADAHARIQYQAASIESARSTQREILRIQREADEATLSGIDKLEYERKAAEADWVREHGQNAQVIANIDKKYHADEAKVVEEQIKSFNDEAAKSIELFQKMTDEADAFTKRVDQMAAEAGTRGLQGFARIQAEMKAELARFDSEAGPNARPGDVARGEAIIRGGADQQSAELAQRNAEETEQIEAAARAKLLGSERSQTAAIETEYEERMRKYKEELDEQLISQDDYNRRVIAADEEKNAQLVEASRQAREKMAGEFDQFFRGMDHPLQYLKEEGEKVASQAAAALVQRFQDHLGGNKSSPLAGDFGMSHVWDKLAGRPSGSTASPSQISGHTAMTLSSAQIQIQSATIGFGGGFGGGGSSARAGGSGLSGDYGVAYSAGGAGVDSGAPGSYSSGGSTIGGAGSTGYSSADSTVAVGSPAAMPGNNPVGGALQGVNVGLGMGRQAMSIFGGAKNKVGTDNNTDTVSTIDPGDGSGGVFNPGGGNSGGMLNGGGFGNNLMGAASGAMGVYSAYESNGGVGGALSGAMSGMQLGMALGGPMGAAIGAAAGAVLGAIGMGGREKARVYDLKQVRPRIAGDQASYEQGQMDYMSAYSDMQALDLAARQAIYKMGPAAHSYYDDTVKSEIMQAEAKLTSMEKAGRAQFGATAAQYAMGTDYVPRDGMAIIHEGERITPSDQNERITRALESGAASSRMPTDSGGWNGDLHIHAMDAKSVKQLLFDNKHNLRAAVNQSLAENSGGADAGY